MQRAPARPAGGGAVTQQQQLHKKAHEVRACMCTLIYPWLIALVQLISAAVSIEEKGGNLSRAAELYREGIANLEQAFQLAFTPAEWCVPVLSLHIPMPTGRCSGSKRVHFIRKCKTYTLWQASACRS